MANTPTSISINSFGQLGKELEFKFMNYKFLEKFIASSWQSTKWKKNLYQTTLRYFKIIYELHLFMLINIFIPLTIYLKLLQKTN